MDSRKEIELDRLVSEMFDEGASAERMQRLESLLLDDSVMQERYWQLVNTHVALGVAIGGPRNSRADAARDGQRTASPHRPPRGRLPQGDSSTLRGAWRSFPGAVAAAGVVICLLTWLVVSERWQAIPAPANLDSSLHWTVDRMPTVTHVSWEGPSFSQDEEKWQPIAAAGAGSISLQVEQGRTADGYLFCLPPGSSVKLVATFDATGENCLSVAEIGGVDRRPIRKATFNNSGVGPRPFHANPAAINRRYGVLGSWSESNTTSSPRYFLLTGSHKLAGPPSEDDWQLSEMEVLLNQDSVIHLSWDDSGPEPTPGEAYRQDDDFDDLAASLFFSHPHAPTSHDKGGLAVVGSQDDSLEGTLPEFSDAYRLTLAPGEIALLKASADATAPNAVYLVDAETGAVRWATSNRSTRSRNLGAAAVINQSSTARELLLVAGYQATMDGKAVEGWKESTRKTLHEQSGFVILGFDDAKKDGDFNDLRVSALLDSLQPTAAN